MDANASNAAPITPTMAQPASRAAVGTVKGPLISAAASRFSIGGSYICGPIYDGAIPTGHANAADAYGEALLSPGQGIVFDGRVPRRFALAGGKMRAGCVSRSRKCAQPQAYWYYDWASGQAIEAIFECSLCLSKGRASIACAGAPSIIDRTSLRTPRATVRGRPRGNAGFAEDLSGRLSTRRIDHWRRPGRTRGSAARGSADVAIISKVHPVRSHSTLPRVASTQP